MMSISRLSIYAALLFGLFTSSVAFVPSNNAVAHRTSSLHMTLLTAGGKKVDVPAGSPLKNACAKLGVKPKYSCKRWIRIYLQACVHVSFILYTQIFVSCQGRLRFMHHLCWRVTYQSMCWKGPPSAQAQESPRKGIGNQINIQIPPMK